MYGKIIADRRNRDRCGALQREMIHARGDRREGHRGASVLGGPLQAFEITGAQERILAVSPSVPDRPGRVDHIFGGEIIALCDFGLARAAAAERAALVQKTRPRGAVDRAVHTAAAQQRAVGGVDDRIGPLAGDIPADNEKSFHLHPLNSISILPSGALSTISDVPSPWRSMMRWARTSSICFWISLRRLRAP